MTPRRAVGLPLARPETCADAERVTVGQLRDLHPELGTTAALLDRFAELIRTRGCDHATERLEGWMADAEDADIPELRAFVTKLR